MRKHSPHSNQCTNAPVNEVTVYLANAFTHAGTGGNPAGVVLDAEHLGTEHRQTIAADVGLSETAFVRRRQDGDFELAFHTPTRAIAHCGHATLAAFSVVARERSLRHGSYRHHTVDGVRRVDIGADGVFMAQGRLIEEPLSADLRKDAASALGLAALEGERIASTGNRFLLVPLNAAAELAKLEPNLEQIAALSEALDLIGIYVYTGDTGSSSVAVSTRMFAPRFGIDEEAATGMAAAPLGAVLLGGHGTDLTIEQGRYMPVPSVSRLQVRRDAEGGIWVGGTATITGERVIGL